MTVYNFDHLSVLLVEDNQNVAAVLREVLKDVRVGDITVMGDGAQAIEHLKAIKAKVLASENWGPDVVIGDLVMPSVNGLVLLRWLRTSADSPNRFMPFIMLSGAADLDHVAAARDLGADEFLVKPFSALSIYNHLLNVVDHRRPFIMAPNFFGPDRRRHHGPPPEDDRRVHDVDGVISPRGGEPPVIPSKGESEGKVWRFEPGRRLARKLGGRPGMVGEVPMGIVDQAEAVLNRTQSKFAEWAGAYIESLTALTKEATGEGDLAKREETFARINIIAHELRGQGGMFGYPLVTTIGKMLYVATLQGHPDDDRATEIVLCHIDALRAVLNDEMTGDGGVVGRDLIKGLKAAIAKHLHPGESA